MLSLGHVAHNLTQKPRVVMYFLNSQTFQVVLRLSCQLIPRERERERDTLSLEEFQYCFTQQYFIYSWYLRFLSMKHYVQCHNCRKYIKLGTRGPWPNAKTACCVYFLNNQTFQVLLHLNPSITFPDKTYKESLWVSILFYTVIVYFQLISSISFRVTSTFTCVYFPIVLF